MISRWRWAIVAGVALSLAIVLYFRLDTARMQKALPPAVFRLIHANIAFDHLSFSAVHGLDIRLDHVRMRHAFWQLKAPTVLLELRVVPLILGKIDLEGIYLRSPVIQFSPRNEKHATVLERHGLPRDLMLDNLSVSNATLISDQGQTWISGLDMDIQDIGPSRTVRWELQARTGEQTAVGHGQLNLRLGTIYGGFGKLSLARIPLQALRSLTRISGLTNRISFYGYKQLSSVLTMSIGHDDQWTLFGDTKLTGGPNQPLIRIRGRLYRDTSHQLGWKDSFIQFGSDSQFAVEGSCNADGACTTAIHGNSIDLAPLANATSTATSFWMPISGNVNIQANLNWRRNIWNLAGQAEMKDTTWKNAKGKFTLPNFHIRDLLIRSRGPELNLKSAQIGFVKDSGILLASGHYALDSHSGNLRLRLEDLQDAWVPVMNLASNFFPGKSLPMNGQGIMVGNTDLSISEGKPELHFSLDGTKAEIQLDEAKKPAGVVAVASGDWKPGINDTLLTVRRATLGNSTLNDLLWKSTKNRRVLSVKAVNLDMQVLRKQGVQFPAPFKSFEGVIAGSLSTAWNTPTPAKLPSNLWPGLPGLTAKLNLSRFGTRTWQLQGPLVFDGGRGTLHKLLLTGAHGNAELDGYISFAHMFGNVDFHKGNLIWNSSDSIPNWLRPMHLSGSVDGFDVSWLGQKWSGLKARYRLDGPHLLIPTLYSGLASGVVKCRDLNLDFGNGTIALRGYAQIGGILAQRLEGLSNPLQGQLVGRTYATVKFDGNLPFTGWENWRNDGNIKIFSGSWRPSPLDGKVQAVYHFEKLGFRFRTSHGRSSMKSILFENNKARYTGAAALNGNGTLQGNLKRLRDGARFTFGGTWPHISWRPLPAASKP